MMCEGAGSLLGLQDPEIDFWGRLAEGLVSIKVLGKVAIRFDSWKRVIHR